MNSSTVCEAVSRSSSYFCEASWLARSASSSLALPISSRSRRVVGTSAAMVAPIAIPTAPRSSGCSSISVVNSPLARRNCSTPPWPVLLVRWRRDRVADWALPTRPWARWLRLSLVERNLSLTAPPVELALLRMSDTFDLIVSPTPASLSLMPPPLSRS